MKTKVSEKGQIVIPQPLRYQLGLRPGQVLECREEGGKFVAMKVEAEDPVDSVYGILKPRRSTDQLIAELRGEPDAV
jgi:AbrB family looped-hinge helix DNA binding protein